MKGFLEQYGVGIFVLVLTSILIAFASPIGKTIKNDITTKVNNIEKITDDETEIAKGNYYTIVFDGNGATSGSMKPMKVICGKKFKIPNCKFKKDGVEFSTLWCTTSDGNGDRYAYNGSDISDIAKKGETIILYAIWGYKLDLNAILDGKVCYWGHGYGTCDIYIDGKCVAKNVSDFNRAYSNGTKWEIKNIKAKNGHTYVGMQNNQTTSGIMNKLISLFPMFITNTYTITYHANASDVVGSTSISHHTYDKSSQLTQNGFTRNGYTFIGWNTSRDGTGTTFTDLQEVKNLTDQNDVNIDLYAIWKSN